METRFTVGWIPETKLKSILNLVYLLNEERVSMELLQNRLKSMIPMGYKCIGVYNEEELIGICGVWELNKLYTGKHLEADNVIISPEYQGKGIGKLMMEFLHDYALRMGCETAEVNCYIKNEKGKRFWENQGYEALGYHMIKKIQP